MTGDFAGRAAGRPGRSGRNTYRLLCVPAALGLLAQALFAAVRPPTALAAPAAMAPVVAPGVPATATTTAVRHVVADFDGDGRTDISVFRPSGGGWFLRTTPPVSLAYGASGDVPVPADYDGDGRADIAVYRPATGAWFLHASSSGTDSAVTYGGLPGDIPVPADYDGDGSADIAVYRPATGAWFLHASSSGTDSAVTYGGQPSDVPVPADYDGDGRADVAVFRAAAGAWFVHRSSGGDTALGYGRAGDIPVAADHDGDGRSDIAVFRPATGTWFVRASLTGADTARTYGGVAGDLPVPGDYDGDGVADIAIFRAPTGGWFVRSSATGTDTATTWGVPGDVPLPVPSGTWARLPPLQLSADPFTNSTSAHRTEVEPDSFSFGKSIVAAFQVGRFFDGGASDIGWATSPDGGASWAKGFLPGITKFAGGTYDRVSDPSVAYDAAHGTWLVSSLPLVEAPSPDGAGVLVNRSTDGGFTWSPPVTLVARAGLDKNWTVCDNTATSPFYGHCYTEWDDSGAGDLVYMSTSTNGGVTWSPPATTADRATGLGGQPLVLPNGTVVVPIDNSAEAGVLSFVSTNGGATWGSAVTVSAISGHSVAGGLRTGPLISAEVDGGGRVYVTWQDCRFEPGCAANDIVMSTSANGVAWTLPVRIPLDPVGSGVDHFIPGVAVDRATAGAGARLGLAYHYYPSSACTSATCQLDVGFVSSTDGGATWSTPRQLAGPMALTWLANTSQGLMVGDYISTSFSGGTAHPVFAVARPPAGSVLDEAVFADTVPVAPGTVPVAADAVLSSGERVAPAPATTR